MKRVALMLAAALPLACWGDEPVAPAPAEAPAATSAPAPAAPAETAPAAAPAAPLRLVPLTTGKPRIPDEVCRQRLAGSVDLDFVVLPDGKVAQVVVTASDPKGVFDAAAAAAVGESTYAPQTKPVKLHRRMLLNASDCSAEQLRAAAAAPASEGASASQVDCITLAAEAKGAGERFESNDSGRAVLQGEPAQTYWAPGPGCLLKGRTLKAGSRLRAHLEYRGFSLVSNRGGEEDSAVWVRSNRLKDVEP
jgi:TonB family protein